MSSKKPTKKRLKGRRPPPRFSPARVPFVTVPTYDYSMTLKKTIRYEPAIPSSYIVTNMNVADALIVNTAAVFASAAPMRLCLAIRIIRVKIYGRATASGASFDRSIQWISSTPTAPFGGPSKIEGCSSVFPGNSMVSSRPPPESYAAQWINCQNNNIAAAVNLVTITATTGDIVDITYELVLNTSSIQTTISFPPTFSGSANTPIYALCIAGGGSGLIPQYYTPYY